MGTKVWFEIVVNGFDPFMDMIYLSGNASKSDILIQIRFCLFQNGIIGREKNKDSNIKFIRTSTGYAFKSLIQTIWLEFPTT